MTRVRTAMVNEVIRLDSRVSIVRRVVFFEDEDGRPEGVLQVVTRIPPMDSSPPSGTT